MTEAEQIAALQASVAELESTVIETLGVLRKVVAVKMGGKDLLAIIDAATARLTRA